MTKKLTDRLARRDDLGALKALMDVSTSELQKTWVFDLGVIIVL